MTTILVTGATGKVGRRLVPRLVRWAGAGRVRVLVRDAARAGDLAALGVDVVSGDLREAGDRARALDGASVVVNVAAAFRGVPEEEVWAVNRDAAVALGREAAAAGVRRFVQASTTLVYGRGLGRPAVEEDRLAPDPAWGIYPVSKAEAEAGLAELGGRLPLVVARLAFVYGEGDPHLADSLHWAGAWPAHQRLATVHHADVSQALWRAAVTPGIAGRTYNVCDDAPLTAWDLHVLNGAVHPGGGAAATAEFDPWEGQGSTAAARRDLGWRPQYPSAWAALEAGAL
ncbi:NAD-dependent epimerase/dehydratase family protein [Kitasatospora sp. NPDC059408]|uniref:NAD-dependent epimerase/dehydratase family protein n=1 Tax=Kitasatospora sp. NPDC059408 TaxID=3346823 RepID=UPI00369DA9FC